MSKVFDWVIKRVSRWVGTYGNALLYFLLTREIYKQVYTLESNDEMRALAITRKLFGDGVIESADRHPALFRVFPDTPEKALRYINILWQIFFGIDVGPYTKTQGNDPETGREVHVFQLEQCPFCGSYGSDPEDTVEFSQDPADKDKEGLGCIICGMIQRVANAHIFRGTGYKLRVTETACMMRGSHYMEVTAEVYTDEGWAAEFGDAQDFIPEESASSRGWRIDLTRVEDLLEAPLDRVKDKVAELVEQFAKMPPADVFRYFENYEPDFLRVLGFLPTHLLNEYGSLLDKILVNPTFSRTVGFVFRKVRNDYKLFVPPQVIDDNKRFFIEFITGLAPDDMVNRFKEISPMDLVDLILEGVEIALADLHVDFSGVPENIWDELQRQNLVKDAEGEWQPLVFELLEEISALYITLLRLPSNLLLSSADAQARELVNSRIEIFEVLQDHFDNIFDILQELGTNK